MVYYVHLDKADFGPLSTAADEWKRLESTYQGLGDQFSQRLAKPLEAHWEGKAAEAAKSTLAAAKKEFAAASQEASRVARLIADIHTTLSGYQKRLRQFQEGLAEQHLAIDSNGVITDKHPGPRPDQPESYDLLAKQRWQNERKRVVEAATAQLNRILREATEADHAAAAALRADFNGQDDDRFNVKGHNKVSEALAAQRKAKLAADLLKDPDKLTPTQLAQLNDLLRHNRNDPVFATRFAESLGGGRAALEKMTDLFMLSPGEQSKPIARELVKHLGMTLGTATRSADPAMERFEKELISATEASHLGPKTPHRYKVLSALVSHGEWEKDFLTSYARQLIRRDREFAPPEYHPFDPNVIPRDPMTGMLSGLSQNPEAALEVFKLKDGKFNEDLTYLWKERDWPGGHPAKKYLGEALYAATSGHDADLRSNRYMVEHDPEGAALANQIIKEVAKDKSLATSGISDSLGKIGAEYMPALNRAFRTQGDIMPVFDPGVNVNEQEAAHFLYAVGRDEQGNYELVRGQAIYTGELAQFHANNPGEADMPLDQKIRHIAYTGGYIQGIEAMAKRDHILHEGLENDASYNERWKLGGEIVKGGISTAGAAAGAGGPGAAAAATAVAEGSKLAVDQIVKAVERDDLDKHAYESGAAYAQHQQRSIRSTIGAFGIEQDGNGNTVSMNPRTTFGKTPDQLTAMIEDEVRRAYSDANKIRNLGVTSPESAKD